MNKPQPAAEATVNHVADNKILITLHTPDAIHVVNAAQAYGKVWHDAVLGKPNRHTLSVSDGYNPAEVAVYLQSLVEE